jgi:hypothetical protein
MPRGLFFEHLKGELWARLQSLIRKQKKIYIHLITAHSTLRMGGRGSGVGSGGGGSGSAGRTPSLYQRAMFVRAKLPDDTNLDPASTLPSAPRAKNYRLRFAGLLSAASGATVAPAQPGVSSGSVSARAPTISYMFPAAEKSDSESDGQDDAEETNMSAQGAEEAAAILRPKTAPAASAALTPRRPRTPVSYNSNKTFFELFGLDALNESLAPTLRQEHEQALQAGTGGSSWKPYAFEVPTPHAQVSDTAGTTDNVFTDAAASQMETSRAVLLSEAQENRWHFRSHALSPSATERKRAQREKLLLQLRMQAPSLSNAGAAAAPPAVSSPSSSFVSTLSLESVPVAWRSALRDQAETLAAELAGLSVEQLAQRLEQARMDEQKTALEDDEVAADVVAVEEETEAGEVEQLAHATNTFDEIALPLVTDENGELNSAERNDSVPKALSVSLDEECRDLSNHSDKPTPRLWGSTPQHFFLSHGHQLLYAGWGTPAARKLDSLSVATSPPPSQHFVLSERMQSRASKSLIGVRFDSVWHVERESERKWLAAHLRTQHIQHAIAHLQSLSDAMHATAALPGLVVATAKKIDLGHQTEQVLQRISAAGQHAAQKKAAPPNKRSKDKDEAEAEQKRQKQQDQSSAGKSDNFYPPSSSTHIGLSAKATHILDAQVPHLASLVLAAEEVADPYGDDFLPSAAEQSVAAAAAAAAGLMIVPPLRRRIEGGPSFEAPRPVMRVSSSVPDAADPEKTQMRADPEPALRGFRVSKQAIEKSKQAIMTTLASRKTHETNDSSDSAANPAAPPVAGSLSTHARPSSAPFTDQNVFPPQQYPSFAPNALTVVALESSRQPTGATSVSVHSGSSTARPASSTSGLSSFRRSTTGAMSSVRPQTSSSIWPAPNLHEASLAAAMKNALIPPADAGLVHDRQPEMMHIRPWAPRKELHSSQLSHCVPLPPSSALTGSTYVALSRPQSRAGSSTARSRIHSARVARRASAGSATARTTHNAAARNDALVTQMTQSLQSTGEFIVHHVSVSLTGPKSLSSTQAAPRTDSSLQQSLSPRVGNPSTSPIRVSARSFPRLAAAEVLTMHGDGTSTEHVVLPPPAVGTGSMEHGDGSPSTTTVSAWPVDPPSEPDSRPVSRKGPSRKTHGKQDGDVASAAAAALAPIKPHRPSKSPKRRSKHARRPTELLHPDAALLLAAHQAKQQTAAEIAKPGELVNEATEDAEQAAASPAEATAANDTASPVSSEFATLPMVEAPFAAFFEGLPNEASSSDPPSDQGQNHSTHTAVATVAGLEAAATTSTEATEGVSQPTPHRPVSLSPAHRRQGSAQHTLASPPSSRSVSARRSSKVYSTDATGMPQSTDISRSPSPQRSASSAHAVQGHLRAPSNMLSPADVMQSNLYKPSTNFRERSLGGSFAQTRSRSESPMHGEEDGDEHTDAANALPGRSGRTRQRGRHAKKLSVFSEATQRRFEASSRWQLIDHLYENQKAEVPTAQLIPLTRITSSHALLDHLGQPLPDRPLPILKTLRATGEEVLVQPNVHRPESASEDEADEVAAAELAQLSQEEKKERLAARLSKQLQRVLAAQAAADRRAKDALEEEELADSEEEQDGVPISDRMHRRRARLARFKSLTMDEAQVAEAVDLDAAEHELSERIAALADIASADGPEGEGIIHAELKAMRRLEIEARLREQYRDVSLPSSMQRRAAAFHAMDNEFAAAPPAKTIDEPLPLFKPLHARQTSVLQISFTGHPANAHTATSDPSDAPSTIQEQQPTSSGSGAGAGLSVRSRAARNKQALAHSSRAIILSRVNKDLEVAAKQSARRKATSAVAAAVASAGSFSSLPLQRIFRGSAEASAEPANAEEFKDNHQAEGGSAAVPPLHLPAPGDSSRASTARSGGRRHSTLLQPTGFMYRPGSSGSAQPYPADAFSALVVPGSASATLSVPHSSRLERLSRLDAEEQARRLANAQRLFAQERERLQRYQAELAQRAAIISQQTHGPLPSTRDAAPHELLPASMAAFAPGSAALFGTTTAAAAHSSAAAAASIPPPLVHPSQPSAPLWRTQLVSNAFLVDKSVQHPLQRLKMKQMQASVRPHGRSRMPAPDNLQATR